MKIPTAFLVSCGALLLCGMAHADDYEPEQFWVNYGTTPDKIVISWLTMKEAASTVQYGETRDLGLSASSANASTYTTDLYTSGYIHHVEVSGLKLNTRYYYRVGDAAHSWSSVYSFVSHPGVGKDISHLFGVIGDLGQTFYSNETVQHIIENEGLGSVFISGDLSYADSYQPRWDTWQHMMTPLTANVPVHVAAGNHEIEEWFGTEFTAYNARFQMPFPSKFAASSRNLYYSYEVGPAHILVLCSYCEYGKGTAQYEFAESDLKSINRGLTPWVFVIVHAPWYNSNRVHHTEGVPMREVYEDMMYGLVDMVFAGHVHAYERTHKVYNSTVDTKAPVYVTIGDGGNREGLYNNWIVPQPAWSAFREAEFGHGTLQVNGTTARWMWHRDSEDERVVSDSVLLTKQ